MNNVLFWIGMFAGGACIFFGVILTTVVIMERIQILITEHRVIRSSEKAKKNSVIVAIKIPNGKYYYTPIAYICGRHGTRNPPVVTILEPALFKRLPRDTKVFIVNGEMKVVFPDAANGQTETTIGEIHRALTLYMKSIKGM